MTMIGIRELKEHLSKYVRRVKQGEAIAISEHGREIAQITPSGISRRSGLWELVRQGKVDWNGEKLRVSWPLIKIKGKPLSQTVIEDREDRV